MKMMAAFGRRQGLGAISLKTLAKLALLL